ncbi:4'-phosphopantetheinyl transferase [Streptomyces sp. sk2.1]|uniref:4'-phosphopantetheinyl transferase family protein n=1 Tax=Streptomyces sp. sk2.1 TaxID=2478959 RepID=UPI0011E72201|nr:4'-phosphopantetheinyl transferase superfamily protein [Streptomyces sp. sk2.1]TXS75709.1 4'-phosphopantetheinyl transferase superfamily protein [Streptomyces sp. sk2.1]
MIEQILPYGMAVSEVFGDVPQAHLYPEEARVVERAVAARRSEFATGRWCARQALRRLGLPAMPILPGFDGAPEWPASVLGSITHCTGYRAAVLAQTGDAHMLGIDAEPNAPLPEGILEFIALPEEQRLLDRLRLLAPEVHWDRLLFSIKETVYKSWFPFTQQQLDFDEAIISLETDSTTFTARILPRKWPSPEAGLLQGRWLAKDGLLLSAIAVLGTPEGRTATGRPRQGHAAGNDSLSRKACML